MLTFKDFFTNGILLVSWLSPGPWILWQPHPPWWPLSFSGWVHVPSLLSPPHRSYHVLVICPLWHGSCIPHSFLTLSQCRLVRVHACWISIAGRRYSKWGQQCWPLGTWQGWRRAHISKRAVPCPCLVFSASPSTSLYSQGIWMHLAFRKTLHHRTWYDSIWLDSYHRSLETHNSFFHCYG